MESPSSKKIVLFITCFASFLTPFLSSSVNVAVPSIGEEFAMDAVSLTWVATSYFLAAAVFLVPFGKLADMYGRRKIFIYGLVMIIASSLFLVVSNSALFTIVGRALQGFGCAMVFATSIAILTSVYPPDERGNALGINTAFSYAGLSVGPFIGGSLTQYFGWRSIFLATVLIAAMLLPLTLWKLKGEWSDAKRETFDFPGSIVYGFALVAIMYGFSLLPDMSGALLALAGSVGILAFIWWERRSRNPVLDMSLFSNNKTFLFSNLAALINYSATYAVVFLLSIYLQQLRGLSPQDAGLLLLAQPIAQAIFSPLAGKLSDRIEPRIIASIGMGVTVAGLVFFALLGAGTGLEAIGLALFVLGFGFALFSSPNMNAIMCSVESKFYGVGSAMLGTMRLMGQMMSLGIAALVFAVFIGRVQISPSNYPLFLTSIHVCFAIFAVLCCLGIFASVVRGNVRKPRADHVRSSDGEISASCSNR